MKRILFFVWFIMFGSTLLQAAEPTKAASNATAGTVTCNSAQITWTNGDGGWRIVVVKEGSAVNANPVDGNSYSAFANFGTGTQLGTGNYVCFNNITNNVTITNLKNNTTYHVAVFEHDGTGPDYLTSNPATLSFTTKTLTLGFTFSVGKDSCEGSNKVTFTNTSTTNYGGIKYTWFFGDGQQDTGRNATHVYNKGGSFIVTLTANPANNCIDNYANPKQVFIVPRPVAIPFEKTNDTIQCFEGHIFRLDDKTTLAKIPKCAYIRTWYFTASDSATIPNPVKVFTKAGKYRVFYKAETLYDNNRTGCIDTTSMVLEVVPSPSSGVSINDSIQCLNGNNFTFDNRFPGLVTFSWDFGGGNVVSTKTASKSYTAVGTYPVIHEAFSNIGCNSKDTVFVVVKANVNPTFTGLPAKVCQGSPAISLSPVNPNGKFFGANFGGTNTFLPTGIGNIKIKYVVTDSFCPDSSEQTINISPAPKLNLGRDTTLCDGNSMDITITNPGNITWYDGNTSRTRTFFAASTYWAEVDDNGCKASDTIKIFEEVSPQVTLPADTLLCAGALLKLSVPPFSGNIIWSNGSKDTAIYVSSAGLYRVTLTNKCGTATDEIYINVTSGFCDVFLPNAFTPNGDGRNDFFEITGKGLIPTWLVIYNRWGEIIYDSHTTGVHNRWDGRYQGEIVQEGLYTYLFRYENKTGNRIRRNTIKEAVMVLR